MSDGPQEGSIFEDLPGGPPPELLKYARRMEELRRAGGVPAELMYKIFCIRDGEVRRFEHPDVWESQVTGAHPRLAVAPAKGHVLLMLGLLRCLPGPYQILYVLVVPLRAAEPGRYQCPETLDFDEVERFLTEYRDFLESDGRHNIWVRSASGAGQLVYDRHNIIYAYGRAPWALGRRAGPPRPLACFKQVLRARGLTEGRIALPVPHGHEYHPEYHDSEERIMKRWKWLAGPLVEPTDVDGG